MVALLFFTNSMKYDIVLVQVMETFRKNFTESNSENHSFSEHSATLLSKVLHFEMIASCHGLYEWQRAELSSLNILIMFVRTHTITVCVCVLETAGTFFP